MAQFIKISDKIINLEHVTSVAYFEKRVEVYTTELSSESAGQNDTWIAASRCFDFWHEEAEALRRYFGSLATDLVEQLREEKARAALIDKAAIICQELEAKYGDKPGYYPSNIADWMFGLIDDGKTLEEITTDMVYEAMG
jgi:hypothetical protein